MKSNQILIASSSIDRPSWQPVAEKLTSKNYNVLVYEADHVSNGEVSLDIQIDNTQQSIRYDNRIFDPNNIGAAWYRRPTEFTDHDNDRANQLSLSLERNVIQHALWELVSHDAWLSSPNSIQKAERKLSQLAIASQIGFTIPDTVISNQWASIQENLSEDLIFKPSYSMFYDQSGPKLVYASLMKNNSSSLPLAGIPFPGIWQSYVNKYREWRITVVGDEVFDAAIYTTDAAKDDWRKHQLSTKDVVFKNEPFPYSYKQKCIEYMNRLDLGFGAFDFVETSDGEITFLECNANGQFGWIEDELGHPISASIANHLIRIVKS